MWLAMHLIEEGGHVVFMSFVSSLRIFTVSKALPMSNETIMVLDGGCFWLKRTGERTPPCGTPVLIVFCSDVVP